MLPQTKLNDSHPDISCDTWAEDDYPTILCRWDLVTTGGGNGGKPICRLKLQACYLCHSKALPCDLSQHLADGPTFIDALEDSGFDPAKAVVDDDTLSDAHEQLDTLAPSTPNKRPAVSSPDEGRVAKKLWSRTDTDGSFRRASSQKPDPDALAEVSPTRSTADAPFLDLDLVRQQIRTQVDTVVHAAAEHQQRLSNSRQAIADVLDALGKQVNVAQDHHKSELEKLTKMYDEKVVALRVLQKSFGRYKTRFDKVEEDLIAAKLENATLEEELNHLSQAQDAEETAALDDRIAFLLHERETSSEALSQAISERDAAREELAQAKSEQSEVGLLVEAVKEAREKIAHLETENAKALKEAETARKVVTTLKTKNGKTTRERNVARADIEKLQTELAGQATVAQELNAARADIAQLKSDLAEKDKALVEANATREEAVHLKVINADTITEIAKARAELEKATQERDAARADLTKATAEKNEAQAELEKLEAEGDVAHQEGITARAEIARLRTETFRLSEELKSAQMRPREPYTPSREIRPFQSYPQRGTHSSPHPGSSRPFSPSPARGKPHAPMPGRGGKSHTSMPAYNPRQK